MFPMTDVEKNTLTNIIIEHVEDTFKKIFGVSIRPSLDKISDFDEDDIIVVVGMEEEATSVAMHFVFHRHLLSPLLMRIYPPVMASHETTLEDAACEISNIVCSGLKTHLNENGFSLVMDFPKVIHAHMLNAVNDDGTPDNLNISFLLQSDGLSVDMAMHKKGKKP
jgi:CheY-specific phosphatase CheX